MASKQHYVSLEEKADVLCQLGRLKEAIVMYSHCFETTGDFSPDRLKHFVDALSRNASSTSCLPSPCNKSKKSFPNLKSETKGPTYVRRIADPWSCSSCLGVLCEPVTLPCGHSICLSCMLKDKRTHPVCRKCGADYSRYNEKNACTNVLVKKLCQKYWGEDLILINLRARGNLLFQEGNISEAIAVYSKALDIDSTNHLLLGNRSHALFKRGEFKKALVDAEAAIAERPDWPKGYFRKAAALQKLNEQEEAFKAYYHCLILEGGNNKPVRNQLTKLLYELLEKNTTVNNLRAIDQKDKLGRFSCSEPNLREYNCKSREEIPRETSECAEIIVLDNQPFVGSNERAKSNLGSKLFSSYEHLSLTSLNSRHCEISKNPHPLSSLLDQMLDSGKTPSNLALGERYAFNSDVKKNQAHLDDFYCTEKVATNPRPSACGIINGGIQTRIQQSDRPIPTASVDSNDYDCSLCFRIFLQPVTTPCGHTFCRTCLDRTLDHNSCCPMCKGSLTSYLAERREALDEFVMESVKRLLPREFEERQRGYHSEMEELSGGLKVNQSMTDQQDTQGQEIPVFVCTMTLPGIPCPLHVFEPRYRLMIRRCMETGTRQFGMCCYVDNGTA